MHAHSTIHLIYFLSYNFNERVNAHVKEGFVRLDFYKIVECIKDYTYINSKEQQRKRSLLAVHYTRSINESSFQTESTRKSQI